jgi:hypothetical protein
MTDYLAGGRRIKGREDWKMEERVYSWLLKRGE